MRSVLYHNYFIFNVRRYSFCSDSVALDGFLDGLVVRPDSKAALLDVGNRLVPLFGKGGGKEPGYHHFYIILFAPC